MKIDDLLDEIRNRGLVLPEFQREYVWGRDQAKQLLASLLKGYPVGALLFWRTDNPPDLKNMDRLPQKSGMIRVLLDGQQRLTTLYMLIEGEIPPTIPKQISGPILATSTTTWILESSSTTRSAGCKATRSGAGS